MPELRQSVGRYEILEELGRGGMASVYLARQADLDRLVALKELGALRSSDPSFARRFLREAQLAGSLTDPNIVTVYDFFQDDGAPYIAMEYLENGSVRPHVGRMSLAQIGGVLQAVLAGLAVAERREIVHRDLKPENLLITSNGKVKISDFGIAKATNEVRQATALTSTGVAVGTPNYMAPEQATAQRIGPWTDLYSVGMIAFEFFVGRPAFGDTDNALGVLLRQVNEEIPPVHELDPRVDVNLSNWIAKMVSKDPGGRPVSAAAAWDELEDTLIALVGARWQREAALLPLGAANLGFPVDSAFLPPTEPLPQRPFATTLPPRVIPESPPKKKAKRQVGSKTARLVIAGVALVAAAAALLGRSGGSSTAPQAAAPNIQQPSASSTTAAGSTVGQAPASTTAPSAASGVPLITESMAKEATSARKLATQYDNGAAKIEALSGAKVAGSPTARLAQAMRQTAVDYRAASAAAGAGDRAAYSAALSRVSADKQAVNRALADMQAAAAKPATGTSSPGGAPPSPPVAPTPCSGDSVSDDPSDESC